MLFSNMSEQQKRKEAINVQNHCSKKCLICNSAAANDMTIHSWWFL